ncbi:MAG TPA: type II CAAX endopeptidase family protein [Ktedonobacterales bacterium]|jgi:membrane protease YdiL (CAAX protease family)
MKEHWDALSREEEPLFNAANYQPGGPQPVPAPDADLPTWTFRDTMVGALLTLVPLLALNSLALLQSSAQPATNQPLSPSVDIIDALLTFILQALLEGAFLIAPLWFAVFKPRRLARQHGLAVPELREGLSALGFRSFRLWQGIGALALGVLVIVVAGNLYALIAQALHITVQTNVDELLARANNAPWTTLAIIIGAVIVAPFCEEIFFRGYFFQGLRLRLSVWLAVVLSAVIFGLTHGDPGSLVLLVVIGLLLAIFRWRTRSLWPGMALHMVNNFLGALIIFQALHF